VASERDGWIAVVGIGLLVSSLVAVAAAGESSARPNDDDKDIGSTERRLVSPVAIASSSGPAFPLGRAAGNPPDAQYAAERAIDGNPATFCCLLDDTTTGDRATTIPARASEPVTGHIIFDLGQTLEVVGARLTARSNGGPYNPKQVDFFHFGDNDPENNRLADDIENDPDIKPLLAGHSYPGMGSEAKEDVSWNVVKTRYIGLRVNSSYESGGATHYNFQIGEMEFFVTGKIDLTFAARAEAKSLPQDLQNLRAAIEDLKQSFADRYPSDSLLRRLNEIEKSLRDVVRDSDRNPSDAASAEDPLRRIRQLAERLQELRREALIDANPLMPKRLLFVKRFTYSPGWYYAEFMRASRFGGNLCVLSLVDGTVTELAPKLTGGIFDRYDLSFDGRRVVFGYKAAPGKGFRIYEVGVDGQGLRQLTFDPPDEELRVARYWHPRNKPSGVYRHHTDDFHPCYLPDGGLCFASTRCEQGVLCDQGDSLSVNVLYRMDADGGNMTRLSQGALSESTPSVMNDGRILYTRWEYVDKGVIAVHDLWSMRPDGSGSTEVYGNQIEFPPVLIHGRAIPGMNHLFVTTATMHHPFAVGPIYLIDTHRDIRTHEPIQSLTPDTSLNVDGVGGFPRGENYVHLKNGRWIADNIGPLFSEPYPLADPDSGAGAGKYFLVNCNPDRTWNDPKAYALYLIDAFGNRVPIYDDPNISCWQPVPLTPRPKPPEVGSPSLVATPARRASEGTPESLARASGSIGVAQDAETPGPDEAVVMMSDVYRGLEDTPRGTIRYLRILEQIPRPWSARRFWPDDEAHGQHAIISMHAHIFVKIHHGIVPVGEDGSACFVVPARKNLFFQALDENFMEVQRMRSFVNLLPRETRSCIGCHEPKSAAPAPRLPLALLETPVRPGPQPGENVPRPIHYTTDIQPVLDKHCVECHNADKPEGELDLSGELTTFFNRSYEAIMSRKLVTFIQEFHGPQPRAQKTNVVQLPPRSLGSAASPLIALIREGHYDVKLSQEELVRMITWSDANAPYYGSYFGRRNLTYRDHPDFRPIPTLQSASGIPPKTYE